MQTQRSNHWRTSNGRFLDISITEQHNLLKTPLSLVLGGLNSTTNSVSNPHFFLLRNCDLRVQIGRGSRPPKFSTSAPLISEKSQSLSYICFCVAGPGKQPTLKIMFRHFSREGNFHDIRRVI